MKLRQEKPKCPHGHEVIKFYWPPPGQPASPYPYRCPPTCRFSPDYIRPLRERPLGSSMYEEDE